MASIHLDHFPQQALVGVDAMSLTVRHLKAIVNLPPGTHFLWASESTKALRSGVWLVAGMPAHTGTGLGGTDAHAADTDAERGLDDRFQLQWDMHKEIFTPRLHMRISDAALVQDTSHHTDVIFDYTNPPTTGNTSALEATRLWPALVNCVSQSMLDRVAGGSGLCITHTTDVVRGCIVPASEAALNATLGPLAESMAEKELAFSFIPGEKTYDTRLTGAALTASATDATDYMLRAAAQLPDEAELVGELQFAFVNGAHLGNEACLQVWWHMVLRVFLHAYALAVQKPGVTAQFLRALAAQLAYDAALLDGAVVEQAAGLGRQLRLAVTVYGRRLREEVEPVVGSRGEGAEVLAAFGKLCGVLEEVLGWDTSGDYVRSGPVTLEDGEVVELEMQDLEDEDERGEFAAVVLDLDADGRPRDLLSWD